MTSIFKMVSESPSEFREIFTLSKHGRKKISKGEIIKVDYCMPGLMRDASGARRAIPLPELDHIPQEIVRNQFCILIMFTLHYSCSW